MGKRLRENKNRVRDPLFSTVRLQNRIRISLNTLLRRQLNLEPLPLENPLPASEQEVVEYLEAIVQKSEKNECRTIV